jgi:hypothetical protein
MLEVLGIKNIGKLIPSAEDHKPKDPVSENMAVLNMKPVKAFIYQDHQSHIAVHQAAMQDPKIMQMVGQNPQAQVMGAAMMAHINEHIAFEYRKQIEEQMGIPLPKMDEEMSPEIEVQMSQLMAQAAQKLLQKDQAEMAQQQAQQAAQDPIVQMQQKELEIKQGELALKEKKLTVDAAAKLKQLTIEEARIAAQKEIAGAQLGAKITNDKATHENNMRLEGMRLGAQITKDRQQMQQQRGQSQPQSQPKKTN